MSAEIRQLQQEVDARIRGVVVPAYSHATIGEAFVVPHTLNVTPSMVSALPYTDARVWAEEADERLWNAKRVVLRCNIAQAPLRLLIVG